MGKIYDQTLLTASEGMVKYKVNSIMHQISKVTRLTEVKELIDRSVEIFETFEEELELAARKGKS